MPWTQVYDPVSRLAISALAAAAPLLLFFAVLAFARLSSWLSALLSTAAALLLAVFLWGMPPVPALSSSLLGVANALFPILWIVVSAIWVHGLSEASGQFDVIRSSLTRVSTDRRIQALFIAFAFGAFLEGAAGFGTPVAITATMLVGLGFEARGAAVICLIANSSPVAFAAAGVPIAVAAGVSGLDVLAITRVIGRQVSVLSLIVPLWMCVVLCGWRKSLQVLPAILVAGILLGRIPAPHLQHQRPLDRGRPGRIADDGRALALHAVVEAATSVGDGPPAARRAGCANGTTGPTAQPEGRTSAVRTLRAWSPYLLMSVLVLLWGIGPIKTLLQHLDPTFGWPGLQGRVLRAPPITAGPSPYAAVYSFPIVSGAGTAIFLSGVISSFILPGLGPLKAIRVLGRSLKQLRVTIATVCAVLATAYVMNYSGMSSTLGLALSATGVLFPVFSPLLGWFGCSSPGRTRPRTRCSAPSSAPPPERLGLNPTLMVAANASGGVAGKMISPQSLSVATASAGLPRQEGVLLRSTIAHSIAMALVVSVIVTVQAYLLR